MTPQKEPQISPNDRVQINFSKGFIYEFIITTPSKLGFDSPMTLTTLYEKLKERKKIQHYEGRYPAVIDTFFISSVSISKDHFKGV